ncbi:MAG: thiamine-phosphate kinase [candidate division WOR-3 bacterium]|nr:thiamine-phosphate kinase [candidate division WOR-3 bacterium]
MSRLEDIGEQGFLDRLPEWLKTRNPRIKVGIGDDALVIADGTVVTSDSYVEDIHFSRLYFSPEDIGYKSAAATLSDLAGMGAEPLSLLVNLFAPPRCEIDFLKRLYSGMEEVCGRLGAEIAGGDTVSSDRLILSLTALGRSENPLLRCGARPGDLLYYSGFPGLSAVGQQALRKDLKGFRESKAKHLRPQPRIALGLALRGVATACIDTSDGLSTDAGHLAYSSRVKLIIEHERLPRHPEVLAFAEQYGGHWDSLALNRGEDYELLFTASHDLPDRIADLPIHRIGRIKEGKGAFLEIGGELKPLKPRGWDHFK